MRATRPTIDPAVPQEARVLLAARGADLPTYDTPPSALPRRDRWGLNPAAHRAASRLRGAAAQVVFVSVLLVMLRNMEFTPSLWPPDFGDLWDIEVGEDGVPMPVQDLSPWEWTRQLFLWALTTLVAPGVLLLGAASALINAPILVTGVRREDAAAARAVHTYHGRYVVPDDVDEDYQPVLARAQRARDAVAASPLPNLDQARLILADLEWSVASQLRDQAAQRRTLHDQQLTGEAAEQANVELGQACEHTLALVETMVTYAERVEKASTERDTELTRLLAVDQGAEDRRALAADAATNPLRGQALEDLIEGTPQRQSTRGN